MEGGADVQGQEAAHAMRLGEAAPPARSRSWLPEITACVRLVVVGELAHLALSRFGGERLGHVLADAQQRRHRPLPYRHGGLHGLARAAFKRPGGVGQAERPGGRQGGVFAQRVARRRT